MNNSIDVRGATLADASEVIRLLALLGHAQPGGDATRRLAAFLERGEQVLVAARSTSAAATPLLGAVTLHVTNVLHRPGPIGRMTALAVDESARGQGVGTALVRAAEEIFTTRGCALIEVTSNKKRTDAHAFYEKLGYTATSFRFAKTVQPAGGMR
jgi:ribosomal protein S18 acetylase RimI-like enzyme